MSAITAEDLPGSTAPILGASMLTRVRKLNRDYLDLLIAEHVSRCDHGQLQHFPLKLHATLPTLSSTP